MTAPTKRRPMPRRYDGPVALAAEILRGTANLRGAACTAQPRLYDPDVSAEELGLTDAERWGRVKATCVQCPARGRCWEWANGLTGHARPRGVLPDVIQNPFASVRRWERQRLAAEEEPAPGAPPTPRRGRHLKPSIHRKKNRARSHRR